MGLLRQGGGASSPQQTHEVYVANDLFWISGEMITMGNPHNYINQEGLNFINVNAPHLAPWPFTGLPLSHPPEIILYRERIQMLAFPGQEAQSQFRPPIRTHPLILYYPLAVIRGDAPFLSEAKPHNFMDFWKGKFFPMCNVSIYYLSEGLVELPTELEVIYLNRDMLQTYLEG
ncbi:MAG: hypothetical protein JXA33_29405 [Anaerolineae bacterium]|nr:hypothetical protein [Anaerolineae bacterium]